MQQVLISKDEVSQQKICSSPDQGDPLNIKQEHEELCIHQEGAQVQQLEGTDLISVSFTPVTVKSENEEKPTLLGPHQSQTDKNIDAGHLSNSFTEQMKTESHSEDECFPETVSILDPCSHLNMDNEASESSGPDFKDSNCEWKESTAPKFSLNPLKHKVSAVSLEHINVKRSLGCSECGRTFSLKDHLKRHMTIHSEENQVFCSECGKKFSHKSALQTHMRIHTGEKPFNCSQCNKGFCQKGNLKAHLRTHSKEKPFGCTECDQTFSVKSYVKRHMRVHTGEKPFSCSECGKGFGQSGHLRKHMKIHCEQKPFSCSVCAKRFDMEKTLEYHMKVHLREKPFNCSVCNKSFSWRSNLESHMKKHTGEKPFICLICAKQFRLNSSLVNHSVIHTGMKPCSSTKCDELFGYKDTVESRDDSH
ncbi:gastrula zinc finger protein XlCGF52.1-like isoform X2 [Thalassophryne amazonica]|nr:gastrula zinc finger protein XlCGF52.1-like isoform X2 [Thalassophryne amazonica]XP_034038587.1 gastrula zinc finger protein XlCGF52.1-like isoform X2 [Thalassophryne amazonica]